MRLSRDWQGARALITITHLNERKLSQLRDMWQRGLRSFLLNLLFSFLLRNLTGTFPDYPEVEEGGSAIIFSKKTPQQVQICLRDKVWIYHNHISLTFKVGKFIVLLGLGYCPTSAHMKILSMPVGHRTLKFIQHEFTLLPVSPLDEMWRRVPLILVNSEQLDFQSLLGSGRCLVSSPVPVTPSSPRKPSSPLTTLTPPHVSDC